MPIFKTSAERLIYDYELRRRRVAVNGVTEALEERLAIVLMHHYSRENVPFASQQEFERSLKVSAENLTNLIVWYGVEIAQSLQPFADPQLVIQHLPSILNKIVTHLLKVQESDPDVSLDVRTLTDLQNVLSDSPKEVFSPQHSAQSLQKAARGLKMNIR